MRFSSDTLHYFHQRRHAITREASLRLKDYFVAKAGYRANGDEIAFFIAVSQNTITDVRYCVYGGVATIACCEYVAEWLSNKTFDEVALLTSENILSQLKLPATKLHVVMLILSALKDFHTAINQR